MRDEREEKRGETRKKEEKQEARDKGKKGKKELGRRPEPDFPAFELPLKLLKDIRRINNHPKV